MQDSLHIADLIVRKLKGTISPPEQEELDRWIASDKENRSLYEKATDPKVQLQKLEVYALFRKDKVRQRLEEELFGTKTRRLNPRMFLRYAAAILLPLITAGVVVLYFFRTPESMQLADLDTFIKPGSEQGVLILSDGTAIQLADTALADRIAEGHVTIHKEANILVYTQGETSQQNEPSRLNELRTPRGGSYRLQLADGSQVWLNAGSSLKFPVSFEGKSRREVILEGEAYFEVKHDGKPFIVQAGPTRTQVLGTSFNIAAYAEDEEVVTTLLEGRIMVESTGKGRQEILEPNEQASFVKTSAVMRKTEVQAAGYASWVRGRMEFHNESLESVMKRLSRWYDFEYAFENEAARNFHFSARLEKDESISNILRMLEMSTKVNFDYKNDVIVIK